MAPRVGELRETVEQDNRLPLAVAIDGEPKISDANSFSRHTERIFEP